MAAVGLAVEPVVLAGLSLAIEQEVAREQELVPVAR